MSAPPSLHRKLSLLASLAPSPSLGPSYGDISPELIPVVTLLSAQNHRRYIESNFMLLHDVANDGSPGDRRWTEVYGVLSGTQLAVWDAEALSASRPRKDKFQLSASKPDYLNLADASYKALLSLPSSGKTLANVILVSTTLKNRYILQFSSKELLLKWHAALRLSTFEYVSLQEAYTGALLSARGAKLSDIKVVLAESKYNHEHWISVRFGAGTPWKKCYAVVEQNSKKSKRHPDRFGKISLYENDKIKKARLIATIVSSHCVYAVYPNSPVVIDSGRLIKLEGKVIFNAKEGASDATVFIMPESHSSVPGYDTLIRFLIPSLDAFKLYGRPKKLNADKRDPDSLLFGLPVLPHVHYLQLDDVLNLSQMSSSILWPVSEWTSHLKDVLKTKMQSGYSGCGSTHGFSGALSSPALGSSNQNSRTASPTNPNFTPTPTKRRLSQNINGSADFGSSVTLLEKNQSNSSLPESVSRLLRQGPNNINPRNLYASLYGDNASSYSDNANPYSDNANPYQTSAQPSLSAPLSTGSQKQGSATQLPLPSDSRSGRLSSAPSGSFNDLSLNSGVYDGSPGPGPAGGLASGPAAAAAAVGGSAAFMRTSTGSSSQKPIGANPYVGDSPSRAPQSKLPLPSDNSLNNPLPLPSDFTGDQTANNNGNACLQASHKKNINDLSLPTDGNKRMSEITQIYTDYAKIPSPQGTDRNLYQALQKLNVKKEVDDENFDLNDIISKAKVNEKRNSKQGIDIFNPAYSEALLSPAVDTTNSFNASSSASSVRNSNASQYTDATNNSKSGSSKVQPTLPMISVDDEDLNVPSVAASPYKNSSQNLASPSRPRPNNFSQSPNRVGRTSPAPSGYPNGPSSSPYRSQASPNLSNQGNGFHQQPYQQQAPQRAPQRAPQQTPQQTPQQQQNMYRKPPGSGLRIDTGPLGPNGPRAFPGGSPAKSPIRSPYDYHQ